MCLIPMPKNWIVPNSNVSFWIVPNSIAIILNWVLFQDHIMNCALFQWPEIELCLIPTPSKWIVPNSNVPQLNCSLFPCLTIELCLIPLFLNWIVPNSNVPQLNCALFQCSQTDLCLNPMSQFSDFHVNNNRVFCA